jgi:8-oxo-dGTP diphosphatase
VLIVHQGRILLAKRTIEPYAGHWDIPGGFLEENEHPEAGAIREAREETGLEVRLAGLFGFYVDRYGDDRETGYCLNIYFVAEVVGGEECTDAESSELRWFAPDELPDEIAFDHARIVLQDWARGLLGKD